jgi:hypothetical protein
MRFPVSRRGLLTAGVSGLSLGLLTACGLRLDQDPEIPTLDSTQQLRNRLARILDSTSPGAGDPDTAGEDLADFVAAIGPEWNPPTEFATEAPPTEEDRTFVQAAEVASRAVFEASASVGSGLTPVLADVATGLALIAGTKKPEIITTADELIRAGREELDQNRDDGDDATASPSATGGADADAGTNDSGSQVPKGQAEMFNAILNQSRAAAYGYERLAVNFPIRSRSQRKAALARLESLGRSVRGDAGTPRRGLRRTRTPRRGNSTPPRRMPSRRRNSLSQSRGRRRLRGAAVVGRRTPRRSCGCGNRRGHARSSPLPQPLRFSYDESGTGGGEEVRVPPVLYRVHSRHHRRVSARMPGSRRSTFMATELLDRWKLRFDDVPGSPWAGCESLGHSGAHSGELSGCAAVRRPHFGTYSRACAGAARALKMWNGHGAVRVIRDDRSFRVTLQERLRTKDNLSVLPLGRCPARVGCPAAVSWRFRRQRSSCASRTSSAGWLNSFDADAGLLTGWSEAGPNDSAAAVLRAQLDADPRIVG